MVSSKVTFNTKLSYGIGALGKDFACAPIYIFLMFYFTDVAGLSAAFVGTLFLVARMVDAVTDPVMGMIVDNTRSRFGKFRPWIVIGTLINAVVLVALFSTHLFEGYALYIYAAVVYILWGLTYSIMDIPYWSMIPSLSSSRPEREKLVVWPRLFASVAWFITGSYGLYIVGVLGGEDRGQGFQSVALIIAIFFIFSAILTAMNVKEKVKQTVTAATLEKITIKEVFRIINQNDQLKVLIATVLVFQIANLLVGGFAIYYFAYALGQESLFPIYMMVAGAAEVAGVFLFPRLAAQLPRKNLWVIACSLPIISCAILLFSGLLFPGNMILIGIAGAAIKFGVGIANVLQTVMLADVVDYGEYRTGRRSESVIFSIQTMLVKFAGALGGFIVGIGLTVVGYVPDVEQAHSTIIGLNVLMIAVPTVLMLGSALVYKRYYRLHEGFVAPTKAAANTPSTTGKTNTTAALA
jgi:melibiose permease